jgi:hypothetical protein
MNPAQGRSELLFVFLYLNLRSSEIHLFYNLGDFYWHFLEILWLFIFLFLYSLSNACGRLSLVSDGETGDGKRGIERHKISMVFSQSLWLLASATSDFPQNTQEIQRSQRQNLRKDHAITSHPFPSFENSYFLS